MPPVPLGAKRRWNGRSIGGCSAYVCGSVAVHNNGAFSARWVAARGVCVCTAPMLCSSSSSKKTRTPVLHAVATNGEDEAELCAQPAEFGLVLT